VSLQRERRSDSRRRTRNGALDDQEEVELVRRVMEDYEDMLEKSRRRTPVEKNRQRSRVEQKRRRTPVDPTLLMMGIGKRK